MKPVRDLHEASESIWQPEGGERCWRDEQRKASRLVSPELPSSPSSQSAFISATWDRGACASSSCRTASVVRFFGAIRSVSPGEADPSAGKPRRRTSSRIASRRSNLRSRGYVGMKIHSASSLHGVELVEHRHRASRRVGTLSPANEYDWTGRQTGALQAELNREADSRARRGRGSRRPAGHHRRRRRSVPARPGLEPAPVRS